MGQDSIFAHIWALIGSAGVGALLTTILSAAARALPEPVPMGSRLYLFVYRFANQLLINWDKSDKAK